MDDLKKSFPYQTYYKSKNIWVKIEKTKQKLMN